MSKEQKYKLADSTVIEPLINHWSAWSFLISPVPASLHLLHYQIQIMQSYLEYPNLHIQASQQPELIGGPFIKIPVSRADEVRILLEVTKEKQSSNMQLASTIIEVQNWLVSEAKGQSLEQYYKKIPKALSGYVELVYDYFNRPSIRFLENLLYESNYYNKHLQSLRIFQLDSDHSRTFFLNTPRLLEKEQIDWAIPFEDSWVDQLFRLDVEPQSLGYIRDILGISSADEQRLLPFLSEEPVTLTEKWDKPGVRIRYFGHACLLIEWNGISILTDPYIPSVPTGGGIERLSYKNIPQKIDYVLITHNHQDHFVLESLLRLRCRIECLVVPKSFGILYGDISLKLLAQKIGFKRVIDLDTLESIPLSNGKIIAIPFLGEHGDLAHAKTAYVIRTANEQILIGADSDCLDRQIYKNVCNSLGPIKTVFLGTESVGAPLSWICGPLFPQKINHRHEQSRRYHGCNSKTALELLETVGAQRIYNYAMGLEPWFEHLLGLGLSEDSPQIQESNKLLSEARNKGFLAAERLSGKKDLYIN